MYNDYEYQATKLVEVIDRKVKEEFDYSRSVSLLDNVDALERSMRESLEMWEAWKAGRELIIGVSKMMDKLEDMQKQIDEMHQNWKKSN